MNWQGHNTQPSQLLSHVKLDHVQKAANSPYFLVMGYPSFAPPYSSQMACVVQEMGKA